MTATPEPRRAVRSTALLAGPVLLAFTVPPLGFLASLTLPLLAARVRARLWPGTSPAHGHRWAVLALVGLWLPALLAMATTGRAGSRSTVWLIIPLCAPSGAALLVPAVSAVAVYVAGLSLGTALRHPWPWVLGAWAAPLAYSAADHWLVDVVCVA